MPSPSRSRSRASSSSSSYSYSYSSSAEEAATSAAPPRRSRPKHTAALSDDDELAREIAAADEPELPQPGKAAKPSGRAESPRRRGRRSRSGSRSGSRPHNRRRDEYERRSNGRRGHDDEREYERRRRGEYERDRREYERGRRDHERDRRGHERERRDSDRRGRGGDEDEGPRFSSANAKILARAGRNGAVAGAPATNGARGAQVEMAGPRKTIEDPFETAAKTASGVVDSAAGKTGGLYMPPYKLAQMMKEVRALCLSHAEACGPSRHDTRRAAVRAWTVGISPALPPRRCLCRPRIRRPRSISA